MLAVLTQVLAAEPAPPYSAYGLCLLCGLLIGAAGCYYLLSARYHRADQLREAAEASEKAERLKRRQERTQRINDLERRNLELEEQLHQQRREQPAAAQLAQPASEPQAGVPEQPPVVSPSAPTPEAEAELERFLELSVAPAKPQPVRFYAPAPDVPYIEHRKLSSEPLAVMPVRLQIADGPAGTSATYGFSPEADQSRIIADGIRNLRAFFEFELPPSEQFSRIETRRPGRLEKVNERWEVREKAQLDIS